MSFLVLGLPRSRTAWMANFLTYSDLFCYHEGINKCNSIKEYKDKVEGLGDSTTAYPTIDLISILNPDKIVVIDSEIDRSCEYSLDVYKEDISDTLKSNKDKLDSVDGLHVHLKDLDKNLGDIWEYLSIKPFNSKRASNLINFNVQMHDITDIDVDSIGKILNEVA